MPQLTATIAENVRLARDTYRVRLTCPEVAALIRPGQFVMLRLPGVTDPLLGRPFALYDKTPDGIDVVYLVIGKMTGKLADLGPGDRLEVWGPLGNGFLPIDGCEHVTFVAGGIGQTPFLAYARELFATKTAKRITLFYGVRTADLAAGMTDFRNAGVDVLLATDDGSAGHRGFVTDLLREKRPDGTIITCGPMPMMKAVAAIAAEWGRPCQVSLETPMACGFGACFSCVTGVRTPEGTDYRRVCVEGPVFHASALVWDNG